MRKEALYVVVSYYTNTNHHTQTWVYDDLSEAIKGLESLWEQAFITAGSWLLESESYHEEREAELVWGDGTVRRFELITSNIEENIF